MKTVLITGISGFLGSNLGKCLLERGYHIIGIGRDKNSKPLSELLKQKNFTFFEGNIDSATLSQLDDINIDGVFHLASQIPSSPTLTYANYYEANVITTQNLVDYFKNRKMRFFIYTSTNSVFGKQVINEKISESLSPSPMDYYGLTKSISEKILEIEAKTFETPVLVIRLSSIFGTDDTYGLINTFYHTLKNNEPIELFAKGEIFRSLVFLDDLIAFFENFVLTTTNLESFDIVQFACENSEQTKRIAEIIKNATNSESEIILSDRRSKYDRDVFINTEKLKQKLNFEPSSIEEGIKKYINKKNGI